MQTITPTMQFSVGPCTSISFPADQVETRDGIRYVRQDVRAFDGPCIVRMEADALFGGDESKAYQSEVIVNPTWGQLYETAKAAQQSTRDRHHCYFELASVAGEEVIDGQPTKVLSLFLGS